ncbi:type II secretory pathway pseudopilin PulG [Aneurinibacillus soli]|uniref:Uncharacterized protein n=1 Tax=Aneurinibacillus soli TaxID=1500254 RepID=A0A0U5B0G9_9BACL|nr:type II secretion system protein [Aneurinibacillus soli]PYE64133.1 type II secretory pathway pseudopilin PulG [Aneurinibacillus soli]BAU28082.1 hypothetical protein CB4_02256 [Aneurinibacillus soli]
MPVRYEHGFSMFEVIVTILIVTISVMFIFTLFSSSLDLDQTNKQRQQAIMLAEKTIARCQENYTSRINNPLAVDAATYTSLCGGQTMMDTSQPTPYTISVHIDTPADGLDTSGETAADQIILLQVDVSWPSSKGTRTITRSAYASLR